MKTFFNILQTIAGINNKTFTNKEVSIPDNITNNILCITDTTTEKIVIINVIDAIHSETIKIKNNDNNNNNNTQELLAKIKFNALNTHIYNNMFLTNEIKENLINILNNSQKCLYGFNRLLYLYKIKKNKQVVTTDLAMNDLDIGHKMTFLLIEDKSIFLFNINELITIIESAITNCDNFFSDPKTPLNPYNKQILSKATLYNIYFQIKYTMRKIPILFHCFFISDFSLRKFTEQYEPLIRDYCIKKYVFNTCYEDLYNEVIEMLKHNLYTRNYKIHNEFPKKDLVEIFRPFLHYYYIANYYIGGTIKMYSARKTLFLKLRQFYLFNKTFGRKIIKIIKNNDGSKTTKYVFNKKHLSFHNIKFSSTDMLNINNNSHFLNLNTTNFSIQDTQLHYIGDDTTDSFNTEDVTTINSDTEDENYIESPYQNNNNISNNDVSNNDVSNNDVSNNNVSNNNVSNNDVSNNDVSNNDVSNNDVSNNDVIDNNSISEMSESNDLLEQIINNIAFIEDNNSNDELSDEEDDTDSYS